MKKYYFLFIALCLFIFSKSWSQKKNNKSVIIVFEHSVGSQKLHLDSTIYINALNQNFTVNKFRYYVGGIKLHSKSGKDFSTDEYYLIDEDKPESKFIKLNNARDDYSCIEFIIGVDSTTSCNGIHSGALDPLNGMYWEWNTGYVFMKVEGTSPVSTAPGNKFEYHIGGFKEPVNNIRRMILPITSGDSIIINADLATFFNYRYKINFQELSSVTGAAGSSRIADNYSGMFSVRKK